MIESVCALLQGGAYHIDLQGDNYVGGLPPPPQITKEKYTYQIEMK